MPRNPHADAIAEYVETLAMPEEIKTLISQCQADLYHGPLYLDDDGDPCSCFDDNARPFNFVESTSRISVWLEQNVEGIYADSESDDWAMTEPTGEYVDGEYVEPGFYSWVAAGEIKRTIVGRELYRYV